jgi:hypothetical protein
MSQKEFTPQEVGIEILKKVQEVYNKHKVEKAEVEKCGETEVVGKKEDLEKLQSESSTMPGSVATTGGPSIASQIGLGKGESKKKLPDFLKKKKLKKAINVPKAPEAAMGSPSNSPQTPKMASGTSPEVKEK